MATKNQRKRGKHRNKMASSTEIAKSVRSAVTLNMLLNCKGGSMELEKHKKKNANNWKKEHEVDKYL